MKKLIYLFIIAAIASYAHANDDKNEAWFDAGLTKWSSEKDYLGAIKIFQSACDSNILKGCEYVARVYEDEEWAGHDVKKAKALNKKVFTAGLEDCNRGNMHHCEIAANTASNDMVAAPLYDKACNGGVYTSCFSAGAIQMEKTSALADYKKVLKYFEAGCAGGHTYSCESAGEIYYYHLGDKQTGKQFFEKGGFRGKIDEDGKLQKARMFMQDVEKAQTLGVERLIQNRDDLLINRYMKYTSGCIGIDRGLSQRPDVGPLKIKPMKLEINGSTVESSANWAKLCTNNYNVLAQMSDRDLVTIVAYIAFSKKLRSLDKTYNSVDKNPKKLLDFLFETRWELKSAMIYFPLYLPINSSGSADGIFRQAIERFSNGDQHGFATWYKILMDKDGFVREANRSPFIRAAVDDYLLRYGN